MRYQLWLDLRGWCWIFDMCKLKRNILQPVEEIQRLFQWIKFDIDMRIRDTDVMVASADTIEELIAEADTLDTTYRLVAEAETLEDLKHKVAYLFL